MSQDKNQTIRNVFAEVTVNDFEAALVWYERFFGRPAEARPMDNLANWQITDSAGLQVWRDVERSGKALVTFGVDDLDAHVVSMAKKDIVPSARTANEKVRTATFTDSWGNAITFAESLGAK